MAAGLLFAIGAAADTVAAAPPRPNVLFIVVDDMNDWVGRRDLAPLVQSPHLDALAAAGITFANAHVPAPLCNPSRGAVMSGLRPSDTGLYDNEQDWTRAFDVDKTLTTQFMKAGYDVYGSGKVYHDSIYRKGEWTSWYVPEDVKLRRDPSAPDEGVGGIRFFPVANPASELHDYRAADWAIEKIRERHDRPFFLAVGLTATHMPWAVPKEYFDRFDPAAIEVAPDSSSDLDDVPDIAKGKRALKDQRKMLSSGRQRDAMHAYLAAIAFTDDQIGRILDALASSPYAGDTLIVVWGDNGFHFGEKGMWRKGTLWQESTRVPMVWRVPGVAGGSVVAAPVDLMSVYPAICELAGVPVPAHVRAPSLAPLLADPKAPWPHVALTTREPGASAVVSDRWRYIRYADGSEELYDLVADPGEHRNVAAEPGDAAAKAELARQLPERYARPLPEPFSLRGKTGPTIAAVVILAVAGWWLVRRRRKPRAEGGTAG